VTCLKRTVLTVPQQAGADGRLVRVGDRAGHCHGIREARGLKIDKRNVHMPEPIKNVGTYMVVGRGGRERDRNDQDHGRRQEIGDRTQTSASSLSRARRQPTVEAV